MSTLVFNGGQIWLYTFDPTLALLSNEFSPEISLKTILLVTSSIMFLHLGAVLVHRPGVVQGSRVNEFDKRSASQTGWFLFCIRGPSRN